MEAFIVVAAGVLVLSFLCGSSILFLLKLHKCRWFTFAVPIGFCTLMALMQVGDSYLTFTGHYDQMFSNYAKGVIIVILLISAICYKGIIASFKRIWKYGKWKLPVAIFLFAVFIWVYSRTQTPYRVDDINFYGVYIPGRINSAEFSDIKYDYQSLFVFLSVLLKWCRYVIARFDLGISFLNLGFVQWVPAIITTWTLSFAFVDFFDNIRRRTDSTWSAVIIWIVSGMIMFADYWYFAYPHFGGTMRRLPIVLLLIIMHSMSDDKRKTWVWLAALCMGAAVSISSSGFFITMMILYAWAVYSMIRKRDTWIRELFLMMIYPVLFGCCFEQQLIPVFLGTLGMIGLLALISWKFNLEKYVRYLGWPMLIAVPIGIAVLVYLGYPSAEAVESSVGRTFFTAIANYDMVPELLQFSFAPESWCLGLFNALFWIAAAAGIVFSFVKKSWPLSLLTIILITFFNPFVFNFIGNYLTATAYFRITDIFFNYVVIAELMIILSGALNSKWFKALCLAVFSLMAVLRIMNFKMSQFVMPGSEADADFDSMYHASKEQMGIIKDFSDEFLTAYHTCRVESEDEFYTDNVDDGSIRVASQIYGTPLFTNVKVNNLLGDRFAYVKIDTDEYEQIFARRQPGYNLPDVSYEHACSWAMKRYTDYIILDAQYNWQLQEGLWTCASDIYDEGYYRILMFNTRYWNWNIYQGDAVDYTAQLENGGY
ncbi:MAG: hypothetical protein EOM64_06760 [Erysipelotrichia bacterium]|nr:hypothetical protein [Erysipelotrichia bacterium]